VVPTEEPIGITKPMVECLGIRWLLV
jgi:hypothetical protein